MTSATHPWLTAAALAGLPGLPGSVRRTADWLVRHGVPSRPATGPRGGGGLEWDTAALPAETRKALAASAAAPAAATGITRPASAVAVQQAPIQPPSQAAAACADARARLLAELHRLVDEQGLGLVRAAETLAAALAAGTVDGPLLLAGAQANLRQRKVGAPISASTLVRWHGEHAARGWSGLLPAAVAPRITAANLSDDVAKVLARYASTHGAARNLSHCAQHVNAELGRPWDEWRRLYGRARRALPKLPKTALIKARHTGAARDALLPYKKRDTSVLAPHDVWLVDGHTFKAKVRHPDHGKPFAPEVTAVIDAATRYLVGWSVSLSENVIAVGDAVRHACSVSRVPPAMLYSDNGGGETGKQLDCPIDGIYSRLGISHPKGIAGKPQGHGLIERSWQTTMIRCARQYGSYQHDDADDGTVRKLRLALAREQTAIKRAAADGSVVQLSAAVPGWQQFIADVAAEVQRYNTLHRHRSLPKHTSGPHKGQHMTPAEALAAMAESVEPALQLDDATIAALFMPSLMRTPQRGWVRLLNQHYYSEALMAHGVDGVPCSVRYDIHDASRVQVWTAQGRYVCEAQLDGNRMDYMPKPAIELAREKRVRAALKRLDIKRETAMAELAPQLEAPTAPLVFPPADRPAAELVQRVDIAAPAEVEAAADPHGRPPFFESAAERYEWLMQHRTSWLPADADWLAGYVAGADYAALTDYYASRGIAWPDTGDVPGFEVAG